jgi:NAD+ kinase
LAAIACSNQKIGSGTLKKYKSRSNQMKTICIFGLSANPVGIHHKKIVEALALEFDEVRVIPCGGRPDKSATNQIDPLHRAAMCDISFSGIPNVVVEYFDLENDKFTRDWELYEKYKSLGNIWFAVGSDMIVGGKDGKSVIQKLWEKGEELWQQRNFVVLKRQGYEFTLDDLPPHSRVLNIVTSGSSTEIRQRIQNSIPYQDLVERKVAEYLWRHKVYLLDFYHSIGSFQFDEFRPFIFYNGKNPKAQKQAEELLKVYRIRDQDSNCVLVLGGDGTLLHAIRELWRLRIPFFGRNLGHLGFLMNDINSVDRLMALTRPAAVSLDLRTSKLLYVEAETSDGRFLRALAFNDAWMQAPCESQKPRKMARIEMKINGQIKYESLSGDGVLVASASGSSAYSRALGGPILDIGKPDLVLSGIGISLPYDWRPRVIDQDSVVDLRNINPERCPTYGFADNIPLGEVVSLKVRASRVAAAELLLLPGHDPVEKLRRTQQILR